MKSSNSTSGLFAGSHARNELHVLHGTDQDQHNRDSSSTRESATKTCRVCGDEIGLKENGERFVACGECGFPVCRPCYEYERSEGNQSCPQCHTRYKRHKGCPRVEGDDEENFDDDFEDEFRLKNHHANHVSHHHDSVNSTNY